jgi:tol-pal system protein YbgF
MAAELRMLQEQNQQLSVTVAQLIDALKAVTARMEANEQFQQRRFADQEVLVKSLGSDLSAIRERTQDTDTRMRSLSDEIEAMRRTILSIPSLIQQAQTSALPLDPSDPNAAAAAPAGSPAPAPPPPIALQSTAGLSPNRMYETAFADYTSGQYAAAITGLEQLVNTFPTAERADDAQYLIGESLYHLNRFADAAAAYDQVLQRYGTGDQVDMALYKRGLAQERLGDITSARASWEEVVKRLPETPGASLARQSLVRLSRQTPASPPRQ